jgi:N-acetylmuramoyl-L-alanine amidase
MKNKDFTFIIDNGHGSVINGVPQTAGKRSPDFGDGILYEGVSNRRLAAKVIEKSEAFGACCYNLVPELQDISLKERVKRINALSKNQNTILISIHSDAWINEHAHGWSAYTTKGGTKSDDVASIMYGHAKAAGLKIRDDYSDGDPDKESDFYILRKTICPAVLVENLFMTNKKDYEFLLSECGQDQLSDIIVNTIKEIFNNGL